MYNLLVKPFVRKMDIDKASARAKTYFKFISLLPGGHRINRLLHPNRPLGLQKEVFGLDFYNPVGLGAGLDRRGDLYYELENLGFSFVEIGPLDASATRNAIDNIKRHPQSDILMACIEKDYLLSFSLAYDFCDVFVFQARDAAVRELMDPILDCRISYEGYKPVVVRLKEDFTESEICDIVDYCRYSGVDGIETRSIEQTRFIANLTGGRYPIIANCHIKSPADATAALEAGAYLIEVRSGIVTEGPGLVRKILKNLSEMPKYVTKQ